MGIPLDTHETIFFGFFTAALLLVLKHFSDIQRQLVEKRRDSYSKLLTALNGYLTVQSNENYMTLNQSRAEAFLLASDEVATSMGDFFRAAEDVRSNELEEKNANPENMLRHYAEMVLSMRKDGFEKSKLTIDQVIKIMPIGYSKRLK